MWKVLYYNYRKEREVKTMKELMGKRLEEVLTILEADGVKLENIEWDDNNTPLEKLLALPEENEDRQTANLHIGGYWIDEHLVIGFWDGVVDTVYYT